MSLDPLTGPGRPAPAPAAKQARPVIASADVSAVPAEPPDAASAPAPAVLPSVSAPALPQPRSLQELAEALRKVNLTFDLFEIKAQIDVQDSGQVVVRIINDRTGEVLRQIPSEEAQRLAAALTEGRGVLTDLSA